LVAAGLLDLRNEGERIAAFAEIERGVDTSL